MAIHHNFKKDQKILVIKKDGAQIIDRYYGSTSKYLKLNSCDLEWKDIRCTTIYKDRTAEE